ncbi:MAG: DUF1624 domain-containing protein [Lachnospiraceae bacterium]|jgi:uncharacterized membrane protein|nr:DUF1624 domain-containing protein [Lachnospiraceae bacterium]
MRQAKSEKKSRIPALDIIRGIAIINMVFYHLLYNMVYIFDYKISWFSLREAYLWQQAICITFIIVAGLSFPLSKSPWRKGLILTVCAAMVSLATWLVMPEQLIVFGILHFMAVAVLLTAALSKILSKIPSGAGFAVALTLFLLFRNISSGYLSFFGWWETTLPQSFYQNDWLFALGFSSSSFRSADYFPLLPWWFLFLAGFFASKWWTAGMEAWQKRSDFTVKRGYRIMDGSIGFLGRRSLLIYMLHQPLLMGVLWLLEGVNK